MGIDCKPPLSSPLLLCLFSFFSSSSSPPYSPPPFGDKVSSVQSSLKLASSEDDLELLPLLPDVGIIGVLSHPIYGVLGSRTQSLAPAREALHQLNDMPNLYYVFSSKHLYAHAYLQAYFSLFYVYDWFFLHVCKCTACIPGALGEQKETDPPLARVRDSCKLPGSGN